MDIKHVAKLYLEGFERDKWAANPYSHLCYGFHTAHIDDWRAYKTKVANDLRSARYKAKRDAKLANAWPMEKQRRSRVDWRAILPIEIAENQERYERLMTALAMHNAGLTCREIGERIGVSGSRAGQIVKQAERYNRHHKVKKYGSPAERFMSNNFEFRALQPRGKFIAHGYLSEIASMDRYDSKRDWLFVASR